MTAFDEPRELGVPPVWLRDDTEEYERKAIELWNRAYALQRQSDEFRKIYEEPRK